MSHVKRTWEISLAYPLPDEDGADLIATMTYLDGLIETAVGRGRDSSGAGFSERDLQFGGFPTRRAARDARARIIAAMDRELGCHVAVFVGIEPSDDELEAEFDAALVAASGSRLMS